MLYFQRFSLFFKKKEKINETSWIKTILKNYYWKSFINYKKEEGKEKLKQEAIKIIKALPEQEFRVDHHE